ncbi:MAG TPA: prephenate dehydrogenase [Anaerolineales bacterium]
MSGQIAIIGLGQIGASIGMALKQANSSLHRVGFDKDAAVARAAESLNAVDEVARRLSDAIHGADIIVLALPLAGVQDVARQIASWVKDGAVVMDTAPIKSSTAAGMRQLLPEGRYYVGIVPAVTAGALAAPETGLKAARPDLFMRTVMMIDLPRGMPEEVEQLAVNFTRLLGAKPLLADLGESDGIMASTHILPQLAAAAVLDATIDQPGWGDGRKLAGRPFVGVTGGLAYYDDPASLQAAALANPQAVVHALTVLLSFLQDLRDDIENGDEAAIHRRLQSAFEARERWLTERGAADWLTEGGEPAELPKMGEQVVQMLFGNRIIDRTKRKPGKK